MHSNYREQTNIYIFGHFELDVRCQEMKFQSILSYARDAFSQLMSLTRAVLGRRLFAAVLRPSVYAQFVAGETEREIAASMGKMNSLGLRPMLAVPIEEDLGEGSG